MTRVLVAKYGRKPFLKVVRTLGSNPMNRVAVYIVVVVLLAIATRSFYSFCERARHECPTCPTTTSDPPPLPPTYYQFHEAALRLPQHHWQNDRPLPNESFFYGAGHSQCVGWGNAMQEVLLNTYLAYKAKRSFVFANYTWNPDGSLYSTYNGKKIPSQIPFSVMIRGPSVGDPLPEGSHAPPAVSRDYYEKLCKGRKTIIPRHEVHDHLSSPNNAQEITDAWLAKLNSISNPCVESKKETDQLYNYLVFGDPKAMLEIWPSLSTSPVLTHFGWSPLVELAFDTNRHLFLPVSPLIPYLSGQPFTTNAERYTMIPGLMAVHIRRGDYEQHCVNLANWGSTWLAFNSFPEMLDQFNPPPRGGPRGELAIQEFYRPHCYPNIQEIVERVHEVRRTPAARGVRRLYIMTNGDRAWLAELKEALRRADDWDSIATSRDLVLNLEQKYVSQAVDMLVGQRAQILIGNGFSTVTSNIVTMRMANRFPADSTRFL